MPELLYSSSKSSSHPTSFRSRPRSHDHHTLLHFSSRTRPSSPPPSTCNFFVYENRYFTANHQHFGGVEKTFVIHRVSPRDIRASRPIESPRSNVSRSLGTISILPIVHYLFHLIKREIFYIYEYVSFVFLRLYPRLRLLGRVLSVVTH